MLQRARRAVLRSLKAHVSRLGPVSEHQHVGNRLLPLSAATGQQRGWFWFGSKEERRRGQPRVPEPYPRKCYEYKLGPLTIKDDYWWLCDYAQAKPYLEKEQLYYKQISRLLAPQVQQLLQEMKAHHAAVQHLDPPETVGQWEYWTVDNPHGQGTIRRRCLSTGREQTLMSAKMLQHDAAQMSRLLGMPVSGDHIGAVKMSQDQQLLAYAISMAQGADQHCCVVKDLPTGQLVSAGIIPAVKSFEWSADGSCLYYCLADESGRPSKVYRRNLQSYSPGEDELLFTDADPKHFVTLTRTKDWQYVLINTHSKLSSEVHLLDIHNSKLPPVCIQPRTPGLEYFVEQYEGHLLLLTNKAGSGSTASQSSTSSNVTPPNSSSTAADQQTAAAEFGGPEAAAFHDYSLMTVPVAAVMAGQGGAEHWRMLVPERPEVAVTDMDVFRGCVVLHELADARPGLTILRLATGQEGADRHASQASSLQIVEQQQVTFPDWVFAVRPGINQDYQAANMRLYISSPAMPESPTDLKLQTGQLVSQQHQPPAAITPNVQHIPLKCRRLWATAPDGRQVPITLLHKEGLPHDGSHPLLVEVYGAYGQVLEADYKAYRLPLVERGWSVALAHVRGGGELGRRWHADGRQLRKANSVTDLLACLQLLLNMGITSAGKIAGHASSAGALALAAAINRKPDWFASAVLEVPFLDWAGAMCGSAAGDLLATHETDEWGDPARDSRVAEMVRCLCPYANLVQGQRYPALLLSAGLMDHLVPFWMPAKYVAKIRTNASGNQSGVHDSGDIRAVVRNMVVLQFDEGAGHFCRGHPAGDLDDIALQYSFMLFNCVQRT